MAFGVGKHFRYLHINKICQNLGASLCQALPFYHAFTGCDATSQFYGKGKKSSWEAWKSYPSATQAFHYALKHPFQSILLASPTFEILERFTGVLYDKTTPISKVNELRKDLFSKKAKLMDSIPPTQVCQWHSMQFFSVTSSLPHDRLPSCNMPTEHYIKLASGP